MLSLGRALHTHGYAADRLEEVLAQASRRLGLIAQFFSTPTSIFASFGPQDDQRTFLMRVEPGEVNLGKLAHLDAVTTAVLHGEMSAAQGARRVTEIVAAPPPYGRLLTTIAYGVASAAAARFLGGGLMEIAVAGGIGLAIGLLALVTGPRPEVGRVFEPLAALLASMLATAAGVAFPGRLSVFVATLAGLIVLVPGLTLTIAMTELASRHLSSGTSRLAAAFMIFLGMAFGVALGSRIGGVVFGVPATVSPVPLPAWTNLIAIVVASLAFVVLLRALPEDAGWILAAGALAVWGGHLGSEALGVELGVFVGALVVGVASNFYARYRDRPATITLVPGILLLVPGSVGFRSLASLLQRQVVVGVETAFTMIITAVALAAGLLIANIVSPGRR